MLNCKMPINHRLDSVPEFAHGYWSDYSKGDSKIKFWCKVQWKGTFTIHGWIVKVWLISRRNDNTKTKSFHYHPIEKFDFEDPISLGPSVVHPTQVEVRGRSGTWPWGGGRSGGTSASFQVTSSHRSRSTTWTVRLSLSSSIPSRRAEVLLLVWA